MLNASAPLMGFQDLRTNQRLKEVLQAIQGSFIGIFAEMIGLRLFLIALDYLGSADNPGVAFLKQYPNSALPIGFFLVLMYLSCFVAFMSGVSLIERWTGVPQSKNGTALGALMGLGLGLTAAGKVVKAGGKGVKAGVKGISMAREGMKGSYQKMVDGLTGEVSALPDPTKATQVPNAKLIVDNFHLVQMTLRDLNQTRVQLMKKYHPDTPEYRVLKPYWSLYLMNYEALEKSQPQWFSHLRNRLTQEQLIWSGLNLSHEFENTYFTAHKLVKLFVTETMQLLLRRLMRLRTLVLNSLRPSKRLLKIKSSSKI
ncbi:transposase [Lactiplantibacillus pentosus]|uniref:transposase n=1 Tax=Lactiplantibacillus pentosus TaxID=1589 RepID=UPI003315ED9E